MSLTKYQEPELIMASNNPIPFVFESDLTIFDGFFYTVEISGNTDSIILKVYPYEDGKLVYDGSDILNNYVNYDPQVFDIEEITKSDNGMYQYHYTITENIGSTIYDEMTGSGYTFGGVYQYGETFDYENHLPITNESGYTFLSKKMNRKYRLDEYCTINIFGNDITKWDKMVIEPKSTGVIPDVEYKYYYSGSTSGFGIYIFPLGPVQLNNMGLNGDIYFYDSNSPTNTKILNENHKYYEYWLEDDKGDRLTPKGKIYIETECYGYDETEFLWLGELGTYETFSFRFSNKKSFDIKKTETKKLINSVINNEYTYQIGDRGSGIYYISADEIHECESGYLNSTESDDLMEMFLSKDVYVISDGNIYPIIITDKQVDNKQVELDDLFNFKINYKMAYKKLSNL